MSANWSGGKGEGFFSVGNAGKMEYVFGGAFALIIILFLVLTLNTWFSPSGTQSGITPPTDYHLYCPNCKAETVVQIKDLSLQEREQLSRPMTGPMMGPNGPVPVSGGVTCKKCGKPGMVIEQKCPICGQFFFDESTLNPAPTSATPPADRMCPKCHGNITDYWRKLLEKQR